MSPYYKRSLVFVGLALCTLAGNVAVLAHRPVLALVVYGVGFFLLAVLAVLPRA
jgi:hypothetical protein